MSVQEKISKMLNLGPQKTVKMVAVKWKKREKGNGKSINSTRKRILDQIFQNNYKRVVIFENHFGYYNIMMQRPQHLLRNIGDKETLVLYNSYYDIDFEDKNRITQIAQSFYVLDLFFYRKYLLELVKKIPCKYLCVYSTDTVPLSRIEEYLKYEFRIIYEYVDDINPELISPHKISLVLERHSFLLQNKNVLTVATADKLYKNAAHVNGKSKLILLSNGAECDRFSPSEMTDNKEYRNWIRKDKIKVGYYGALASWIDYELLQYLAADNKFQIILIGVEHDNTLKESGLLELENVKYFGRKPYRELAGYVHFFDVCIIPFLINDITKATSPVKLFEYMAMEKPIVTTALSECMKYDVVEIAYTQEEFRDKIYKSWNEREDIEKKEELRQCAWENDWSAKAQKLKCYLSKWEYNEG